MTLSEFFNSLEKEEIRENMLELFFYSAKVTDDKVIISECIPDLISGSVTTLDSNRYLVDLPDINALYDSFPKSDLSIFLFVDGSHEGYHVFQDENYSNPIDEDEREIFLDIVSNSLWTNLKNLNYPDQSYEIDARRNSYRLVFDFISEKYNFDEQLKKDFSLCLLEHLSLYEFQSKLTQETLEKTINKTGEEIIDVIDRFYVYKLNKAKLKLYILPELDLEYAPASEIKDLVFTNRSEQNTEIIKRFADLDRFPIKEQYVRDIIKGSKELEELLNIKNDLSDKKINPEPSTGGNKK